LAVVHVKGSAGLQTPKLPILGYDFVFEVCAHDQTIYVPNIFVKSDSDAQYVEMASRVDANSCQTSSTIVKAANPDSITAILENKGVISEKISILESKIVEIGQKLDDEKKALGEIIKTQSESTDFKTKISESNKKILQLRQELNDARGDYSRFLFVLHATPSKSSVPSKFSFSGTPIEGTKATTLAVTPRVTGVGYNVVFEACAGMQDVRAPLVTVKSDIDSKDVVLANRISPNSCQIGTGQLTANDVNSIQIIFDNTEEFSAKISELENQIASWQADQAAAKRALAELVNKAQKPADYEDKVNHLTSIIVDLRNLINNAKSMLHGSLFAFYA
jgi:predicted  nucleic acid-binding Zn-ribbon protein